MPKALSVRIRICGRFLWRSRATVMDANSDLLIVCLSGCDLISICVVFWVLGFTTDAPRVGFPAFCDPSVYIKSCGFHAAWKGSYRLFLGFWVELGMSGYGFV
jgi:hypothetical protein